MVKTSPDIQIALKHFQLGDLDASKDFCQNIKPDCPEHPQALNLLGLIAYTQGDDHQAVEYMQKAIALRPEYSKAYLNLAKVLQIRGDFPEAIRLCHQALALDSNLAEGYFYLGNIYQQQKQFTKAIKCYQQALEINPDFAQVLACLGDIYLLQSEYLLAIKFYQKTLELMPQWLQVRQNFAFSLSCTTVISFTPELIKQIEITWQTSGVDHQQLVSVTGSYLSQLEPLKCFHSIKQLDLLANNELLKLFLEKAINTNSQIEVALTVMRGVILQNFLKNNLSEHTTNLIVALGLQSCHNEYLLETNREEDDEIEKLKLIIETALNAEKIDINILSKQLIIFSLYQALTCLNNYQRLTEINNWPAEILPIIEIITTFQEQEAVKKEIFSINHPTEKISRLVKSQYEDNPYPRWLSLEQKKAQPLTQILKSSFPGFKVPDFEEKPLKVLVAGCGTGKDAINFATSWQNVEVTAIDISYNSLAYGAHKAKKMGLKNLKFYQGDILNLSNFPEKFSVIVCLGVLHHLADPFQGWQNLVNLLKPQGIMKIGLYSQKARREITEAQNLIKTLQLLPNPSGIRQGRKLIQSSNVRLSKERVIRDFYSLSGCRDLLFHYQEEQFTLPTIEEILKKLNLRFMGFELLKNEVKPIYQKLFPQDSLMTNLQFWDKFEDLYPETFIGMYQFWCEKDRI